MRRISLDDIADILNQACFDLDAHRFKTKDALRILWKLDLLNDSRIDPGPETSDRFEPIPISKLDTKK